MTEALRSALERLWLHDRMAALRLMAKMQVQTQARAQRPKGVKPDRSIYMPHQGEREKARRRRRRPKAKMLDFDSFAAVSKRAAQRQLAVTGRELDLG